MTRRETRGREQRRYDKKTRIEMKAEEAFRKNTSEEKTKKGTGKRVGRREVQNDYKIELSRSKKEGDTKREDGDDGKK